MQPASRAIPVVAVALFLSAGCATYAWHKPDVTPEIAAEDRRQCDEIAWRIANDYRFSAWPGYGPPGYRWPGYWHGGPYGYGPFGDPDPAWTLGVERRALEHCMESKGYRLVKLPNAS